MSLRFRPHHFMCTLGFEGKGYSESFVENFTRIAQELREDPLGDDVLIEVVVGTDSICAPCPNRRGSLCETETRINTLDAAHAEVIGLIPGERIRWGDAKQRIKTQMTLEKFDSACAPCSWKKAGLCEMALKNLLAGAGVLFFSLGLSMNSARADALSDLEQRQAALRSTLIGKTKAPKIAKMLKKASKLLDESKFAETISAATAAEKDPEFVDHALGLKASAAILMAEAEMENETPNWKKVDADASLASKGWHKIADTLLYSSWWSNSGKEMARAELAIALSQAMRKQTANATKTYERAFQRMQAEKAEYFLRPRHIESYGEMCLKKKTELCTSWITKFANQYSKNSLESKTLAKLYPAIVEAGKPFFANSKVTTGYKQKDSDEEAFDQVFPLVIEESYGDAIKAFSKFLTDFPRSAQRFRARYWLAYCHEKKKDFDDAKPHYEQLVRETPLTLYGLLAMQTLKQEPEGRFKGNSPPFTDHDDQQTPLEAARLERIKKLLAAKADKLAALDIRALKARDTATAPYLLWLSSLASTAKSHITAFSILSDLIARMDESVYTVDGLDLVFPVAEWPIIEKQAVLQNVDPIVILSLMKQESAFEREAGSSVGAVGYMQLMPFTASDMEPNVERRGLLDAETNIRIGTKYLKKMLDRYKGNVALALSAYNAGPTATDRWIREGRASRSFLEYVEQIPYKETRDYVGTIFRNVVWYRFRLKAERVNGFGEFWPNPVLPTPQPDKSVSQVTPF